MKFDYCVIGSGAGGALAAYGLSRSGGRVALIEKGDWVKRNQNVVASMTKYYRDQGYVGAVGNAFIGVPTGEAVGGTTTINSGTCFETPPAVVDAWRKEFNLDIHYEAFTPYFKKIEALLSIQEVPEERVSSGNRLFMEGVQKLGFHHAHRLRRAAKNCEGSGRCCFVCPKEAKQSTDVAVIPKFLEKGGVLHAHTTVVKIIEKRDRVVLLCQTHQRRKIKIECSNLVISAGALSSPILLRKNRIGKAWKRAGDDLSLHPATKVLAQFPYSLKGWEGVPQAIGFKHPKFSNLSFEGMFTPFPVAALFLPLEGARFDDWLRNYEATASFGVFIRDSGRGRVRSFPGLGPLLSYHLNRRDFLELVEGARFMGLAYLAAGAKKVLMPLNRAQNEFSDTEALKTYDFSGVKSAQLGAMGFHPLGTCGMGRVVDSHLKVYGTRRIFIADGSVVPTPLGVNPQITIMALALRLADHLLK